MAGSVQKWMVGESHALHKILVIYNVIVQTRQHNITAHCADSLLHTPQLLAGDEVSGECPCVVVDRIGNMVSKVL
jgi:hypothetical protein